VQAYIWATPLVNSVGIAKGLAAVGNDLALPAMVVVDKPLSPKQIFMTGNDVSTYGFSVIDLSKTGPFVVDAPEGILGGIVDFWQRAVIDIGVGDTLKGAKLLLLPPGYGGPVVLRSRADYEPRASATNPLQRARHGRIRLPSG
jgi:hypothetical protein